MSQTIGSHRPMGTAQGVDVKGQPGSVRDTGTGVGAEQGSEGDVLIPTSRTAQDINTTVWHDVPAGGTATTTQVGEGKHTTGAGARLPAEPRQQEVLVDMLGGPTGGPTIDDKASRAGGDGPAGSTLLDRLRLPISPLFYGLTGGLMGAGFSGSNPVLAFAGAAAGVVGGAGLDKVAKHFFDNDDVYAVSHGFKLVGMLAVGAMCIGEHDPEQRALGAMATAFLCGITDGAAALGTAFCFLAVGRC